MLDAELAEAVAIDLARVEAVVHLVFVEDVAQRVPVGRGLHRHVDGVVGVAQLQHLVVVPGDRIGASRQHGVDRIPAAAEQAGLRATAVERDAEREDLAGADQSRRADDVLWRDMVERADLIVLAPTTPILEFLGRFGDSLFAHVDIHRAVLPSSYESFYESFCHASPVVGHAPARVVAVYYARLPLITAKARIQFAKPKSLVPACAGTGGNSTTPRRRRVAARRPARSPPASSARARRRPPARRVRAR